MKYVVFLLDGMADYDVLELGNKTPLEVAYKPNIKSMSKDSYVGLIKSVADGMKPGSDVANLAILGYDPNKYYTGRSPLEAGSIGIDMKATDISLRCNLVTVSEEPNYEDKTLIDYCAGDISTSDAKILVEYLKEHLDDKEFTLYSGVSYRHCLIWDNGTLDIGRITPPHDITGKPVKNYIPENEKLYNYMKKSYELLNNHPLNIERAKKGLNKANSAWLWGEGKKAMLDSFYSKYHLHATMISAVDLLKGIGKFSNMNVVNVEGATGYIDTNFKGKADAAINAFKNGSDFVYIHVEAPDECGHRGEVENKVKSIELIDKFIIGPVVDYLKTQGDFKVLVTPDHATPLAVRTHTNDPIPFMIYDSRKKYDGVENLSEREAKTKGVLIEPGYTLMNKFIKE
ncbi:MAG: cofactor-independent phosphoglycerate mutase [Acholeplasmatales bacterium]|nr:cofactor-independent phosphoglycerate mutase [Acholeplasmatales bacterium]